MKKTELESLVTKGMSLRQIAGHFGFARKSSVRYWMRKYGIVPLKTKNSS